MESAALPPPRWASRADDASAVRAATSAGRAIRRSIERVSNRVRSVRVRGSYARGDEPSSIDPLSTALAVTWSSPRRLSRVCESSHADSTIWSQVPMRPRPFLMTSLTLGFLPAGTIPRQDSVLAARHQPAFAAVDAYVADRMRAARIPGLALVIVEGDRLVYARGYGRADPSGRPVTPSTPFILGSIAKPFTALAVMQLVEAGKVELDAPVQRYLPWFRVADPAASATITVRQMLYQTSGIPQPPTSQAIADQDAGALEHAVRALAMVEPIGQPGTTFAYSNGNYDTLGMIVQAVSGQSYEAYVRQHIFAPLDMRNSFASQDEAIRHGMASGYRWWF